MFKHTLPLTQQLGTLPDPVISFRTFMNIVKTSFKLFIQHSTITAKFAAQLEYNLHFFERD